MIASDKEERARFLNKLFELTSKITEELRNLKEEIETSNELYFTGKDFSLYIIKY